MSNRKIIVNIFIVLGFVSLISFLMVRLLRGRDLDRLDQMSNEYRKLLIHNKSLKKENRLLEKSVDALRSDQRTLERIAREEHSMVRKDEIIFQFNNSRRERTKREGSEDKRKP